MFPLCERCWSGLSPEERLPHYRTMWQSWLDVATDDNYLAELEALWPSIERAVLAGR